MKTGYKPLKDKQYSLLNRWMSDIFYLGDQDEMSWKHIGHGIAALIAEDDWRKGEDYNLPDTDMNIYKVQKLGALWDCIADIMKKQGKQFVLDGLPIIANNNWAMMYANVYVSDYHHEYRTKIEYQNLIVTEGK